MGELRRTSYMLTDPVVMISVVKSGLPTAPTFEISLDTCKTVGSFIHLARYSLTWITYASLSSGVRLAMYTVL